MRTEDGKAKTRGWRFAFQQRILINNINLLELNGLTSKNHTK